jgi:hypothetical protein
MRLSAFKGIFSTDFQGVRGVFKETVKKKVPFEHLNAVGVESLRMKKGEEAHSFERFSGYLEEESRDEDRRTIPASKGYKRCAFNGYT